ncbi:MAG: ABC transporter permease [Actinobacteria bacterium]|nr:ABC transporter permease [Actinomycetota bacterium]
MHAIRGIGVIGNVAAVVVVILVVLAVIGPLIAPHDPNEVSFSATYGGPTAGHPLGFDGTGRDLLSRLLVGARSSLLGPLIVALLATLLGTTIALAAAWFGGRFDAFMSMVLDILFAIPGLLLAILAVAVFGRGLTAPAIALAVAYTPYTARLVRSVSIAEVSSPYIASLLVQGLSSLTICRRHLFPNVRPTVVAQAILSFSFATIDLAALSYLGLGVQPPSANWGLMVSEGQQGIVQGHDAVALWAGGALVVSVLAINVLGSRLMDRAEERGR